MIVLLLQVVMIALLLYVMYATLRFLFQPTRQLHVAQQKGTFYILDDVDNTHKNLLLTYKGALFEGEKYIGEANGTLVVSSIFIHVTDELQLQGFTRQDFYWLEDKIHARYPHAHINWKRTIEELLKQ